MEKKTNWVLFCFLAMIFLATIVLAQSRIVRDCRKNCSSEKRNETKICNGNYKECRVECGEVKKTCLDGLKQNYSDCRNNCTERGCIRECSKEMKAEKKDCSKIDCLKECRDIKNVCREEAKNKSYECRKICEISPYKVSENECEFYHEICNGPYFDVICSKDKFCICDGAGNYSCPQNYTCNHEIEEFLPRKKHTVQGYKDFLGNDLGDIGVCMKD